MEELTLALALSCLTVLFLVILAFRPSHKTKKDERNVRGEPINLALNMLYFSRCNISKNAVGAAVVAQNKEGCIRTFGGCNIELATSKVWHAEEVALTKAISEGYIKPIECYITAKNKQQRAAMCGYCMQHFCYANLDCKIFVVDLDGSVIVETTVRERNGIYGYLGSGRLEA